jgi:molecular chaperone DnaK (HSP70)
MCAIDIGKDVDPVTPEGIIASILRAVRDEALKAVGAPVTDVSISVPTRFTSAQREAVCGAAEKVGFHVSHIAPAPLLAARAMKVSGTLGPPGRAVIVDVGASKTEVSLMHSTIDSVREVRTVGSDQIGSQNVRDGIVR